MYRSLHFKPLIPRHSRQRDSGHCVTQSVPLNTLVGYSALADWCAKTVCTPPHGRDPAVRGESFGGLTNSPVAIQHLEKPMQTKTNAPEIADDDTIDAGSRCRASQYPRARHDQLRIRRDATGAGARRLRCSRPRRPCHRCRDPVRRDAERQGRATAGHPGPSRRRRTRLSASASHCRGGYRVRRRIRGSRLLRPR